MNPLRIATRGSALALWQANRVRDAIAAQGRPTEMVILKTTGDQFTGAPLEQIGVQGVFTKELEEALLGSRADIAVHSMKDVPTEFSTACRIIALFRRDDPRDALISRGGETLEKLRRGARIGTGSLRRASQLRAFRRDFEICEIRGNVDTRLRKVEAGDYDAIVLAKAGLDRLGFTSRITEVLAPEVVLSAVAQGVMCAEYCEFNEDSILGHLNSLSDPETTLAASAERSLMQALQGGCRVPLGAWARFESGNMLMDACVLSPDGTESVRRSGSRPCASITEGLIFGRDLANEMIEAGADRILSLVGRSVGQS